MHPALEDKWTFQLGAFFSKIDTNAYLNGTGGRIGTELSFDASGSVVSNVPEDNVAVGWSWDFGDGETAKGEVVTHTYEKAGTYTVKLTVTDSAGRSATVEEPLVVKEALATVSSDTTESTHTTSESNTATTTTP